MQVVVSLKNQPGKKRDRAGRCGDDGQGGCELVGGENEVAGSDERKDQAEEERRRSNDVKPVLLESRLHRRAIFLNKLFFLDCHLLQLWQEIRLLGGAGASSGVSAYKTPPLIEILGVKRVELWVYGKIFGSRAHISGTPSETDFITAPNDCFRLEQRPSTNELTT